MLVRQMPQVNGPQYEGGIRDVRGETPASGRQVWGNTFVVKGPFTEVVREVRVIENAAHCGLNHPKNWIERFRWFP